MPTTSNFGWTTPADTDLVKDGAAAIRTLGNGVDASLVDLKGGTTGQVLSKATNTDLDYTWITPNVGDITEVQAGTGISVASGTGPIPVITNTATTTIDAEGDLLVGDAADALQRLAIGSNGNVLTVDTSVDGKIKWAAPAGGGKVLQVVQATYSTSFGTTSTSYQDTGLSGSITPSAATSKIMVIATTPMKINGSAGDDLQGSMQLVRTSTSILNYENNFTVYLGAAQWKFPLSMMYLDSPNTTSATTYKTQIKSQGKTITAQEGNSTSVLMLIEIGA